MSDVTAMFITIMTAMILVAALLHSWMRTRAQSKTARAGLESTRQIELLTSENSGLKGQMGRLEERIAVLERIATDPSERTAAAIEQLRQAS